MPNNNSKHHESFILPELVPRLQQINSDKLISDLDDENTSFEEKYKRLKLIHEFTTRSAGQGIFEINLDTLDSKFDSQIKSILGYESNLTDEADKWINLIHPEDLDSAVSEYIKLVKNPSYSFNIELRLRAKNHDWVWFMARGHMIITSNSLFKGT